MSAEVRALGVFSCSNFRIGRNKADLEKGEVGMSSEVATTDRLRSLLAQITYLTTQGEIQWDRQRQSAHRYARWKNNLLILGPDTDSEDKKIPRYLLITPFDSPDCIEINSDHQELGSAVLSLVQAVEAATANKPATDPFAVTDELLNRLTE